jgi:predicted NBD/HSP70 family sugar kinase
MANYIGVNLSSRVTAALVVDHRIAGEISSFPPANSPADDYDDALVELHASNLVRTVCEQVRAVQKGRSDIAGVGVAMPGIIRNGVVEDSPNLPQLKGERIAELLHNELRNEGFDTFVHILNDADGVAAGLAAAIGKLDSFIRVWTLGTGIGYGRYPFGEGVWEGGHTIVTLDDKENYCGCGGRGHMEGIMGHRAMRLRFLDMEPEEVFATARQGGSGRDVPRCRDFVRLWHKALAAGTATQIHMGGPGKFLITGYNARFVDLSMLRDYIQQMVKMSPLQSYAIEIVEDNIETRLIGSAVAAEHAAATYSC